MIIAFAGPQGCGKGTQAELLVERYGFMAVSGGAISRHLSETDEQVREMMNSGVLIPHELIAEGLVAKLEERKPVKPVILDGMPRSLEQLEVIEEALAKLNKKIDRAVLINISKEESIRRLSSRWICRECGTIFNTQTKPSKKEGVCDRCGGELYRRSDETPEAVEKRLEVYHTQTGPVLEEYRKRGILIEIDGERSIEAIHEDIVAQLKKVGVIK